MKTQAVYGNCVMGVLYLILRKKITSIIIVDSRSKWFPWHFVGVTGKGHAIHFEPTLSHELNHFAPWWFLGSYTGVSKTQLNKRLDESGRKLHVKIKGTLPCFLLAGGIWLLFFFPWIIVWAFYPICHAGKWAIHAVLTRRK